MKKLLAVLLVIGSFSAFAAKKVKHDTCTLNIEFKNPLYKPLGGVEAGLIDFLIETKNWKPLHFDISRLTKADLVEGDYYISISFKENKYYGSDYGIIVDITGAQIAKTSNGDHQAQPFLQKRITHYGTAEYAIASNSPRVLTNLIIEKALSSVPKCKVRR